MATAWEYLEKLCRHPHRGSATAGEAAAAVDLSGWLRSMGYTVEVQGFKAPRDTLYLGPAAVLAGFVAAGLLADSRSPWIGLVVCALLLVPLAGEMLGSSNVDFDLILPRYSSRNVVARRPPVVGAAHTVVITAHFDTQRGSYLFHPSLAPHLERYFYVVYAGLLAIPAGLLLRWALPGALWVALLLQGGVVLSSANAAFLVVCRLTGRHINGANDNGSGAALLLALAERWAQEPLPAANVIFVLTGSEEVGSRGMKHFMRTAALDRETSRFINLDNLGGGLVHYLTGEGMLTPRAYSREMVQLARELASEMSATVQPKSNLLLPTDGLIPLVQGYQAITFLAFLENGRLPDYHWHTDVPGRIDRQLLAFSEAYLWRFSRRSAGADEKPAAI